MTGFKTRFAPSPTGYLHLGHAFAGACAFGAARAAGGECVLRIEDTDHTRCRPPFEAAIYEDLEWLGFDWPPPVRRQSDHRGDYEKMLDVLRDNGLVYRCFKTRKEVSHAIGLAPHTDELQAPAFIGAPLAPSEEAARIKAGEAYSWRLSLQACRNFLGDRWDQLSFQEETLEGQHCRESAVTPELLGDMILARKDTGTSYHLACVHDDALQTITHIIRGEDLRSVTHLHVLLQALMGYQTPIYRFHRLISDDNGIRLAKRTGATTLRSMREAGQDPSSVLARAKAS